MPSLLSRFLGKKKTAEPTTLLDGEKYEAVPKTLSPSAATFPESAQRPMSPVKVKTKEQPDRSLGIPIRRKQVSPGLPAESKVKEKLPMLSLHLPDTKLEEKKMQGLGVVFAGITDGPLRLDDEVLGAKRLTATETLSLVQKTSEVICERALETLGVMRPHWFASPRQQEVQLQLINRFLQTLSGSQANGRTTGSTSSPATFESELRYTRDPHDVAAVLRWGLRHLQLDGNHFGSSSSVDWYRSFVDSERLGSYPSKAFDDILVPLLPASHSQLLRATLDLVSSLAAHSEENGISGNKLSKVLGWWIVSSRNVRALGWREFYSQWEAAARQFEHLFLAYIRAQQAQSRMPKRLTEMVKNYPYTKNRQEDDGIFLPRSRFSTRSATALFVRITADKSNASSRPHPLRIVEDAFKADAESNSTGDYVVLWQTLRAIASKPSPSDNDSKAKSETAEVEASLTLSTILADETIRLLSLVPAPDGPSGPTLSLFTPLPTGRPRESYSAGDRSPTTPVTKGNTQGYPKDTSSNDKAAGSPSVSNRDLDVATDWQAFSTAGFESPSGLSLAASLWDTDTEVSQPTPKKGANAGKRNLAVKAGPSRRASADSPAVPPSNQPGRLTYGVPQVIKLDEAFIDFWADTLLDSIARSWPTFVVCQLKAIPKLRLPESDKPIEWLVIERVLVEPTQTPLSPVKTSASSARAASPTPASPTKSESSKGRWTAPTLAATRKRWSLFSHKHESAPVIQRGRDQAVRKASQPAKVGEMGEILRETDENGVTLNGRTKVNGGVNGVKDTKKESEKQQDAMPSKMAIRSEGISKPEGPALTNRNEVVVLEDATPTTAQPTSFQNPVTTGKESSSPSKQVVEATVQSAQLPAITEIPSKLQPVIELAPRVKPVAESDSPVEQLAATPILTLEEPQPPVSPAPLAEPSPSLKADLASHPLTENTVTVPKQAPVAEAITQLKDGQGSTEPAATDDTAIAQPSPSLVDSQPPATEPEIPLPSKALSVESVVPEPQHTSIGVAAASLGEPPADLISEKSEAVPTSVPEEETATVPPVETEVAADLEHEAEMVDPTTVEPTGVDDVEETFSLSIPPEAPAEHEPAQQPDILESEGSEPIPIDEDWEANVEPAVSEPHSENQTDGPNVDLGPAVDDDVAVKEDTAKDAS